MRLRLSLAMLTMLTIWSLDLSAQRGRGYSGITVFEHPDFHGTSVTFRNDIADLRRHGLNDRITSLDVDGSQAWEVCQDINFGGRCRVFTGRVDDLREQGWNDRISSLRPVGFVRGAGGNGWGSGSREPGVRASQSRLVLYERPNYRGDSRDVLNSSANLGSIGDRARSVEVYGGSWELCDGSSRNARCVTVSRNVPDLRQLGLGSGVTSVREAAGQSRSRWW